jgi:hypothetical protein
MIGFELFPVFQKAEYKSHIYLQQSKLPKWQKLFNSEWQQWLSYTSPKGDWLLHFFD